MTQTSNYEFWVSDGVEDAVRKSKVTLKNLGELTAVVPGQHIVGNVAFGVKHVTLKITWRPEEVETKVDRMVTNHANVQTKTIGTMLSIEATLEGGGLSGNEGALKNALERFEDAYMHFDRTDYTPDRFGILPISIVGFVVLLVLIGVLLARNTNLFKATPMPSPSTAPNAPLIAP